MSTVLTLGTFSYPHLGHAAFLRRCEAFGDHLIVGVNSDRFVQEYRGAPAAYDQAERAILIRSLGYEVAINDGPGRDLILDVLPGVLAVGTDWARRDYYAQIGMTQDDLDLYGITLAYVPARPLGISSTDVQRRVAAE